VGSLLSLPTLPQQDNLNAMKQALEAARERLAERMKSLEPAPDAWEKQLLARFEAGEFAVAQSASA